MSGALMNKVWDLFGMDSAEPEGYEEENVYDYDDEEEEVEDKKLFGRKNNNKVVNMPQKIRNIRYIVVSCVATENNVCHMIYARYHTLERKNTDLSGVSACEAAVAIFLLILPQIEQKTS